MFTRKDTVPIRETKFNGPDGEMLGLLLVTIGVVGREKNNTKDNKSPGVIQLLKSKTGATMGNHFTLVKGQIRLDIIKYTEDRK